MLMRHKFDIYEHRQVKNKEWKKRGFPSGPGVRLHTSTSGGTGLIPGWGTKTPHATEQLIPCVATIEPTCSRLHATPRESWLMWQRSCKLQKTQHSQTSKSIS